MDYNYNEKNGQNFQKPPKNKKSKTTIAIAIFGIVIFLFLGLGSCSVGFAAIDSEEEIYYSY